MTNGLNEPTYGLYGFGGPAGGRFTGKGELVTGTGKGELINIFAKQENPKKKESHPGEGQQDDPESN